MRARAPPPGSLRPPASAQQHRASGLSQDVGDVDHEPRTLFAVDQSVVEREGESHHVAQRDLAAVLPRLATDGPEREDAGLAGVGGLLRTGFLLYNTPEEVDRLLSGLHALAAPQRPDAVPLTAD